MYKREVHVIYVFYDFPKKTYYIYFRDLYLWVIQILCVRTIDICVASKNIFICIFIRSKEYPYFSLSEDRIMNLSLIIVPKT
jgi:hypothetical protein